MNARDVGRTAALVGVMLLAIFWCVVLVEGTFRPEATPLVERAMAGLRAWLEL